ncbi:cysteine rich repeat-containing protein [bacterium]|nr:cysteine rich repeat-containing protein [bacterium]
MPGLFGDRRRVRHARHSRRVFLAALLFGVSLAIARVSAASDDGESVADGDSTSDEVLPDSSDDAESYDATQHFEFGTAEQPMEWVRSSDDAMPVVPFEIIDVAAGLAENEGSAKGETKNKNKRQDYQDLAALLHSQAATIDSFHGREDLNPDGQCAKEIKQLCGPEEMDDKHVTNLKFTNTIGDEKKDEKKNDADESDADDSSATITERRRARLLLQDFDDAEASSFEHLTQPDPWGVDEDPAPEPVELSEKDKRIFDLEKKVNALAELMENTQGGAEGVAKIAVTNRPHRPYKSYFECVHATIVDVHQRRAKHVVTPECRAEVRETYSRRFTDIRKDAELMSTCGGGHKGRGSNVEFAPDPDDDDDKTNNAARGEAVAGGDISKFCAEVKPGLGLVFRCLKSHKSELEPECAKVVGFRQIEQAADVSLDAPLALMCEEDRVKLCSGTKWGGGATEQCLKDNRAELSTQCKLEVFRREVEESEDVRYDGFLAEMCAGDKNAFCGDVTPGEGRIMACLEAHVGAAKFSSECRTILDRRVVRRAADWRLDFALRKACAGTVKSMCHAELTAAKTKVSSSGTVLECLKRKFNDGDVDDPQCVDEVKKKMAAAADDIREDTALTLACKQDLNKHCDGVQPGEGRLWTCLAEHRKDVGKECEAKLFEREIWMSGDWRFKYALASECASEAQMLCQGVAAGGGRVIRCLQEKMDSPQMGKKCRKAVFNDQKREHSDIRLHKELSQSCVEDLKTLCDDVEPGEGRVLQCLKDKRTAVQKPECRNAVMRLMMSHADNYLLDAPLTAACHDDVIAHCADIEPGHGRVHECLRAIPNILSQACLDAEVNAESNEAEDIRLKPQILQACASSASTLCPDVKPGHGALLECLVSKTDSNEMDGTCANRLTRFSKRANRHMAFNNMVKKHCPLEAKRLCATGEDVEWVAESAAAAADKSESDDPENSKEDPLTCLVTSVSEIETPECATAVKRTVLRSFKAFRVGTAATTVCDDPAERLCGATKSVHDFQAPGSVLSCLQRNAGEVGDKCWQAVATTLEDGDGKREGSQLGTDNKNLVDEVSDQVRSALLEEVSNSIARRSDDFGAAAARTVTELRKKADSLGTALSLVVFALVGVAAVAFLTLRRMFTLLGRTRNEGKAAGHARRAHNV